MKIRQRQCGPHLAPTPMSSPRPDESVSTTPSDKLVPATPQSLSPLKPADDSGQSQFTCSKCGEKCPASALGERQRSNIPKNPVETVCANNYKGLAKRWRKNPKLRVWWEQLDEASKREWFGKHKRLSEQQPGLKRDFETVLASTTEIAGGTEKRRRVLWKPFGQFLKDEKMRNPQASQSDIEQSWRLLLMGGGDVKKIDGEWHLKEYLGVYEDEVDSQMDRRTVTQRHFATGIDDLQEGVARQGDEMAILRAERSRNRAIDRVVAAAPEFPESYVTQVECAPVAESVSVAGIGFLVKSYEQAVAARKQWHQACMEEAAEAEPFQVEESKKCSKSASVLKLEVEKDIRKATTKVSMLIDEANLESEHLLSHVEQNEFGDSDLVDEWKMLVGDARSSLAKLTTVATAFTSTAKALEGCKDVAQGGGGG